MRRVAWVMSGLMMAASPMAMAAGQETAAAPQRGETPPPETGDGGGDVVDGEEIVVSGELRGAVPGDVKPELSLNPADIRAYGVGSLAELLTELEPQTRSGRGRGSGGPVLLLSGRRISGFSEIRNIPPEAIERIDILPEEAALKLGYRADQRVVNIVLRRRFRAITAEVEGGIATAGGRDSEEVELNMLRLNRDGRVNVTAEYERDSSLLERERDVVTTNTDSQYRTLLPDTQSLSVNGVYSRNIGKVAATANLRLEQNWNESLLGLPSTGGTNPLLRSSDSGTLHGGFSLNGDLSPKWRWSVTGNWDRNENRTLTDRETGLTDRAVSVSNVGSLDALVNGSLAALPAGDISTSVRASARTSDLDSESLRSGLFSTNSIGRDSGAVQANIDLPIASRSRAILSPLGNFSLNANVELEQLSDFGTLITYGYGANWSPIEQVRFVASFTEEEGAPSAQQLGNPTITTPNVRVFDFVRGASVDITRIDGGNPNLIADNRSVMKLGLNLRPLKDTDLTLNVDYNKSVIRNPIASFPTATAAIEAAFPDRFTRDGSGTLIRIDNRPVNFLRSEREQIRWGLNFSKSITSPLAKKMAEQFQAQRAARQAAREAAEARGEAPPQGERGPGQGQRRFGEGGQRGPGGPGGGFGGRGGGFGGGGGPGGGGRLQLGLFHTIALTDKLVIRQGLPELDLLNGAATGSRGGSPRHQVELRAGVVRDGIGLRLNADWNSATTVRGGASSSELLRFDDFATVNLRLFATLGPQFKFVRDNRWLQGTRITLSVDNVFDSRLKVTDASGATPISYQPALLDPLGRTVKLSLRKVFF
ncbi:TonB-dependent receptor [Sphingomonas sp. MG17]|uniref:TonB-dependent receptor n=1 Tax=Sphingomonas tagetis TaxID=2949092 RepID=A0A9X2HQJ7_9SPHN|nr:TonB-dependent receptor [Sphingomonas tagetis]MCP3732621.1 TonB-dependent receptor [Sphingomonas tagetis]